MQKWRSGAPTLCTGRRKAYGLPRAPFLKSARLYKRTRNCYILGGFGGCETENK